MELRHLAGLDNATVGSTLGLSERAVDRLDKARESLRRRLALGEAGPALIAWLDLSYFEYTGDDFAADMRKMAEDSTTQEWWKETMPCQVPLPSRKPGEQWSSMEMVFLME